MAERVATLEADQRHIMEGINKNTATLEAIRETLDRARGGWKAYVVLGTLLAGAGSLVGMWFTKIAPVVGK